jgi:hypothetical protein
MKPSFNLIWTDAKTGNKVQMENMSSKYLANFIIKLGKDCIEPEIIICPNQQYLGNPK